MGEARGLELGCSLSLVPIFITWEGRKARLHRVLGLQSIELV